MSDILTILSTSYSKIAGFSEDIYEKNAPNQTTGFLGSGFDLVTRNEAVLHHLRYYFVNYFFWGRSGGSFR